MTLILKLGGGGFWVRTQSYNILSLVDLKQMSTPCSAPGFFQLEGMFPATLLLSAC